MKKLLSLLLALLLLATPVFADQDVGIIGGADGPTALLVTALTRDQAALDAGRRVNYELSLTEFQGVSLGDASIDAAVKDLLTAVSFAGAVQGEEIDGKVKIGDKDVLTLGWAQSGQDGYIQSNLLGGTVVIGADEVEPLTNRLVDMLALAGLLPSQSAEEIKAQLLMFIGSYAEALEVGVVGRVNPPALTDVDVTPVTDMLARYVTEHVKPVEELVVPRNADTPAAGYTLTVTIEDAAAFGKAVVQCVRENPALMEYIRVNLGFATEAEAEDMWAELEAEGAFKSKDDFLSNYPTMPWLLDNADRTFDDWAQQDVAPMNMTWYMDAAGELVYLTATQEKETPVEVTYARQTLAEGVSHVVNLFLSDTACTLDVLVNGDAVTGSVTLNAAGENVLLADFTMNQQNADGKEHFDLAVQLQADVGEAEPLAIDFSLVSDYTVDGVDFDGADVIRIEAMGMTLGATRRAYTSDPVTSIMAGNVVRPAELDDTAFANWFVGVVNGLQGWLGTVVTSLPESVLMLLMNVGSM